MTTSYRRMTRAQLIDLLEKRRVRGWHHGLVKSGLTWHLEQDDIATHNEETTMATTICKTISGTFTRDDLVRLTWPVAWSGVVPDHEQIEEEVALCDLSRDGVQAIEEWELKEGGEWAARIEAGEIVEVVQVKEAD